MNLSQNDRIFLHTPSERECRPCEVAKTPAPFRSPKGDASEGSCLMFWLPIDRQQDTQYHLVSASGQTIKTLRTGLKGEQC
ncbi:MAG: hypothetical protein ACYCYP_08360 [Leptospirales bacterium]